MRSRDNSVPSRCTPISGCGGYVGLPQRSDISYIHSDLDTDCNTMNDIIRPKTTGTHLNTSCSCSHSSSPPLFARIFGISCTSTLNTPCSWFREPRTSFWACAQLSRGTPRSWTSCSSPTRPRRVMSGWTTSPSGSLFSADVGERVTVMKILSACSWASAVDIVIREMEVRGQGVVYLEYRDSLAGDARIQSCEPVCDLLPPTMCSHSAHPAKPRTLTLPRRNSGYYVVVVLFTMRTSTCAI